MRLLLDEHFDRRLAEQLRARGHDVIGVMERPEPRGLSDDALVDWATAQRRAIGTYNVQHLMPLFAQRISAERSIGGLLLISERSYPAGERGHGRLLRALLRFLEANPSDAALAGRAVWLASG